MRMILSLSTEDGAERAKEFDVKRRRTDVMSSKFHQSTRLYYMHTRNTDDRVTEIPQIVIG